MDGVQDYSSAPFRTKTITPLGAKGVTQWQLIAEILSWNCHHPMGNAPN